MLDAPLQLLVGVVAAFAFWRRGDRPLIAVVKGAIVSFVATILLSFILWISS